MQNEFNMTKMVEKDCISRVQTLKVFAEKCGGECACCEYNGSGYDTAENCKLIKAMPSVTLSRPRGHWIIHPKGIYAHLVCDQCLSSAPYDCKTNFCPNCGADMTESEDNANELNNN